MLIERKFEAVINLLIKKGILTKDEIEQEYYKIKIEEDNYYAEDNRHW